MIFNNELLIGIILGLLAFYAKDIIYSFRKKDDKQEVEKSEHINAHHKLELRVLSLEKDWNSVNSSINEIKNQYKDIFQKLEEMTVIFIQIKTEFSNLPELKREIQEIKQEIDSIRNMK